MGVAEEPYEDMTVSVGYHTLAGAKSVTGTFAQNHSDEAAVQTCILNQARDVMVLDGSTPAGIAANAAFLWDAGPSLRRLA